MTELEKINVDWHETMPPYAWDAILSKLHGHPLQSAKWGDSRKLSYGINDHRWIAFKNGSPVFIVRFEERRLFRFWKIAWAPKGPIILDKGYEKTLYKEFLSRLKKKGFFLCATNPWEKIEFIKKNSSAFYTIWLDLTIKKEKLWENLNKQCRYDIKRAKKLGVVIETSTSFDDLNSFYNICESISKTKGFDLGHSWQLMSNLLSNTEYDQAVVPAEPFAMGESKAGESRFSPLWCERELISRDASAQQAFPRPELVEGLAGIADDQVESSLFVARYKDTLCGGAFLVRCGESAHYFWGAVNRKFSHLCIGEAIQWECIEWALSKNCKKYDLEGLSPRKNSGVDQFKKKFGGSIVAYPAVQIYPLHLGRKIILSLGKIYLLLQPNINKYKKYFSVGGLLFFLKRSNMNS